MVAETRMLERNLGRIVLGLLLIACVAILLPFLSALLWAVVLSFAIWPLYRRLLKIVPGRRTLATLLILLVIILVVLLPLVVVGATLADNVRELAAAARQWIDAGPPA